MKIFRNMKTFTAMLLLFLLIVTPIANVKASTIDEPSVKNLNPFTTREETLNYLTENNVPIDKQTILMDKLDKDILWDCYNPEKVSQIPEDFYIFRLDDPINNDRYYRFEDGSFIAINTEGSDDSSKTRAIISDSYGTRYTDHRVSKSVGLAQAGFRSDFYVARYGTSSFIGDGNPWDQYATGLGCSGTPSIQTIRLREEIASPYNRAAMIRIYWQATTNVSVSWPTKGVTLGATIPVGTTMSLYLALVNNAYYVDSQLPAHIYN